MTKWHLLSSYYCQTLMEALINSFNQQMILTNGINKCCDELIFLLISGTHKRTEADTRLVLYKISRGFVEKVINLLRNFCNTSLLWKLEVEGKRLSPMNILVYFLWGFTRHQIVEIIKTTQIFFN